MFDCDGGEGPEAEEDCRRGRYASGSVAVDESRREWADEAVEKDVEGNGHGDRGARPAEFGLEGDDEDAGGGARCG